MEPLITIDATAWVTANRTKDSHAVARSEIFCLSKNSDNITTSPVPLSLLFWILATLKRSQFGFVPLNLFLIPYINMVVVTIFSLVLPLILLSYHKIW